jgi:hypothetical protein
MPRRSTVALVVLLAALTAVMRWAFVNATQIIVDEFEHLHAGYLVARGQVPYLDFFEHHTPLFYYATAAVLPMKSATFQTIVYARYLALACGAVTMLLAWRLVRIVFGRTETLVVACLLLGNFFLFARGSLAYLDTFAAPLVMLSALWLVDSRGRPLRCFGSSVALGLALLFTQKAMVVGLAPAIVFVTRGVRELRAGGERSRWLGDVAAYALGGLVPVALLLILLGIDGFKAFVDEAVLLNMAWKARHFPSRELSVLAITDGAVYVLAIIGATAQLWKLATRGLAVTDEDIPALFLVSLGAGIFLLPVVWEEYFIVLVPFAVVVAGVMLVRWTRPYLSSADAFQPSSGAPHRVGSWAALVLLGVMLADLIARKLVAQNPLSLGALLTVAALWSLILTSIRWTAANDSYRAAVLWMAFVLVFPLIEQADWIYHNSNAQQRERVGYVLSHTGPDEAVFDGYSGYGVFRPHAYRYWFLHEEMQQMLSAKEMGPDIIAALEEGKPPIAIVDAWTSTLPEDVRRYIASNYVDTAFVDIKQRKGRVETLATDR